MADDLFDEKVLKWLMTYSMKKYSKEFKKDHLVPKLQEQKNMMFQQNDEINVVKNKVTELERSHLLYLQYGRCESVEITGIPKKIRQENLEEEVIKNYNEAGVSVFGRSVNSTDISG